PAFAHWLIKIASRPKDIILDPFCGIGTIPLEADLMGRKAIGFDLNDYAVAISKAKFDRRTLNDNLTWLSEVKLNEDAVKIDNVSDYVKQFYHPKTLSEILSLKEAMIRDHRDFLLGCLLGIAHGHRPQYLSAWTGYIVPFTPKIRPEYKMVMPRMIAKVKRVYQTEVPLETNAVIKKCDAREKNVPDDSVDLVISSPPYFNTIDYTASNKLRLALLGVEGDNISRLKNNLIQNEKDYLKQMALVGKRLVESLKDGSLCIFVLGDLHNGDTFRNTAIEISELYKSLGFETLAIIEDEIPLARRIANKWNGNEKLNQTRRKMDRILLMKLNKRA
ncbi:MAG: DNA methyltransferase, partial [Caldisphaera sp.]